LFLVAELQGLAGIAEAINALSDRALIMGETLRLGWRNRRRMSADAEDLHEPLGAVIHALVLKRQAARFV